LEKAGYTVESSEHIFSPMVRPSYILLEQKFYNSEFLLSECCAIIPGRPKGI